MSKHVPALNWKPFNAELATYALAHSQGFKADILALTLHILKLRALAPRTKGSDIHWLAEQHILSLEAALRQAEAARALVPQT